MVGTILVITRIEVILILGCFLVIPLIIMVIPTTVLLEITLGEATKLLDNIMTNYSQWHTERSTNKKVHAIEEINVLSGKMDELKTLISSIAWTFLLVDLLVCH